MQSRPVTLSRKNKAYAMLCDLWMDMDTKDPMSLEINYLLAQMIKEGWHEPCEGTE